MKAYFWLPFCCLLGLLVGSWGAKEEALQLRREINLLERVPKGKALTGFDALARMTRIPAKSSRREKRIRVEKVEVGGKGKTVEQPAGSLSVQKGPFPEKKDAEDPRQDPHDLRERIEEARELWNLRMEVARTQTVASLGLDGGGTEAFDRIIGEMNGKIHGWMKEIASELRDRDSVSPESAVRIMAVMGSALADTYDQIGALVPEEKRETVSGIHLTDFIDPGVAEPLIGIEDKLR